MKVAVLGCGGWGLTLGMVLHENGHEVIFWTHSQAEVDLLTTERQYQDKLPGVIIPVALQFTTDLQKALHNAGLVLLVVPSQHMRSVAKQVAQFEPSVVPIMVSATKGITEDSLQRMSQVLLTEIPWLYPEKVVALSGPSHAEEVSRGIPTTVVSASIDEESALVVQQCFSSKTLRVYTADDIVGVELAGSLKNVIAIATGILDGIGLGDNTKGALMTRGLAEITRLGESLGAKPRTFAGLTGMGDLITTCMSRHSRNRYVGEEVGRGKTLDQVLAGMKMVAEGVPTCRSAIGLAKVAKVEMPITEEVYHVLFDGKSAKQAIQDLMNRDLKAEVWK